MDHGRRFHSPLLFLAALCLLTSQMKAQQGTGAISGIVVSQNGEPLAGAEVDADEIGLSARSKAIRLALTDSKGAFRFEPVKFGTYKLFALKPEAGYPDTKFELYATQYHPAMAVVSAATPSPVVRVIVGPRSGILKIAVIDRETRQPIPNPTFVLRRIDNGVWVSNGQSGDPAILLPPTIPIEVTVEAAGFRSWTIGDPNRPDSGAPFRMKSGEELQTTIALEAEPGP